MKIIQILPELNVGGVEKGTLEVAAHLVKNGHQSVVISNGGLLVDPLERAGSRHIEMPVHRKSLRSLAQIPALRNLFLKEKPDLVHVRSRLPAWLTWAALKTLPMRDRPRLVSTVHGFYSVNGYSAIMTKGEVVITVSNAVKEYVQKNYPATPIERLRVIHRGVDESVYHPHFTPSQEWLASWQASQPALEERIPLLLPGRLTRWKGQEEFIKLIAGLVERGLPVQGLIVGAAHPKKAGFADELKELAKTLRVTDFVSFLGHRDDLREIMAISRIVYSLSKDPEAFGRTSLEALALGKPVIAYHHGGVAEQLQIVYPGGLVPIGDLDAMLKTTLAILQGLPGPSSIDPFTLQRMLDATLEVYQSLLRLPR